MDVDIYILCIYTEKSAVAKRKLDGAMERAALHTQLNLYRGYFLRMFFGDFKWRYKRDDDMVSMGMDIVYINRETRINIYDGSQK